MSRKDSKAPLLEGNPVALPSPAREAIEANLDTHSNLTLSKKKSWFGSLRDVVQKGASQAKKAVDSFRGDQSESKQSKPEARSEADRDTESRDSISSTNTDISSPAMKSRRQQALESLAPRDGKGPIQRSLRYVSAKDHHKRGSVSSAAGRPSSEMSDIHGPDRILSSPDSDDIPPGHKRRISLAKSLAGSLRGLGGGTSKSRSASTRKLSSPGKAAENVPLPSSPINIPAAAPIVELDLGPAGFMPSAFASPAETERKQEDLNLTNPANIATGVPKLCYLAISDEYKTTSASSARPTTPSDLLDLQNHSVEASWDMSTRAPPTPMPGTNLGLEVDGANIDKSNISPAFERSVTPPDMKECKELRTICSLDATAEACNSAPTPNDKQQITGREKENKPNGEQSLKIKASTEDQFYTPRRDAWSGSTVASCPSDMADLTRQETPRSVKRGEDHQQTTEGDLPGDDPFLMSGAAGPSPSPSVRTTVLPFRPKSVMNHREKGSVTEVQGPPSEPRTSEVDPVREMVTLPSPLCFGRNFGIPKNREADDTCKRGSLKEEIAMFIGKLPSDDDKQTRAQDSSTSDVVPDHDKMESPARDGRSLNCGPVPLSGLYHFIQTSRGPTPGSARARVTYAAGLGDSEHKFTFDKWFRDDSVVVAPHEQPRTPRHRSMDESIDSASTSDERQAPRISPMSNSIRETPYDQSNEGESDLSRSLKSLCHRTPSQGDLADALRASPAGQAPSLRLVSGRSVDIDANALQFADFEHAYASSRAGSLQGGARVLGTCLDTDESTANSLQGADIDYNLPEESLDQTRGYPQIVPDLNTTEFWDKLMFESGLEDKPSYERRFPSSQHLSKEDITIIAEESTVQHRNDRSSSPTFLHIESLSLTESVGTEGTFSSPTDASSVVSAEASQSSADSEPIRETAQIKEQVASLNKLDDSFHHLSSPDSGYDADKGSVTPQPKPKTLPASRYRRLDKRNNTTKPLAHLTIHFG